ncbi:hypothetical protein SB748_31300, partial [Rhizobium sp. SIMBA_035]
TTASLVASVFDARQFERWDGTLSVSTCVIDLNTTLRMTLRGAPARRTRKRFAELRKNLLSQPLGTRSLNAP